MEDLCSPFSLGCFYLEEGVEELRHSLLYTTIELETTIMSAKEEITKREFELMGLKDFLFKTERERDEAQENCKKLLQEKEILNQQLAHQMLQQEDESNGSNSTKNLASPDCIDTMPQSPNSFAPPEPALKLAYYRPLPEKGKLLNAVIEAGPLLKTLLLAGPLPQWQHPPPQLDSTEIPPVAISSVSLSPKLVHQYSFSCLDVNMNCEAKKRSRVVAFDSCDFSSPSRKCQRVVLS